MRVSVAINAGGDSSRMGENKALRLFAGQPLIARMWARLDGFGQERLMTTRQTESFSFLGVRLVNDLLPGRGALSGLHTALAAASFPVVVVLGCDMPFINPTLLRAQCALLEQEGADAVIVRTENGLEPLHGVYRRATCLPPVEAALMADRRRLVGWLPEVKVREMELEEAAAFDPLLRSWMNINTPEDFHRAELLDG